MLSLPKHQPSIFKLSLSKLTLHSQPSKLQRRRSIQQSSIRTAEGSSEANLQSAIRTAEGSSGANLQSLRKNTYLQLPISFYF
jgi:hypothetical protein